MFQQNSLTNTRPHTHKHTPPPCGSAPDFPTAPSLPVSNLPPKATSVSPLVFGVLEAVLPASPRSLRFTFVGHDEKVRGPKQGVPGGKTDRGRPRWEGAEHPEEPPPLPSPGGPYCACVYLSTHAYTLSTASPAPPPPPCALRVCAHLSDKRVRRPRKCLKKITIWDSA
jgi:hypothetical protein